MTKPNRPCPECHEDDSLLASRRLFLAAAGAGAVVAGTGLWPAVARAEDAAKATASEPETLVKVLYESLKPEQKKEVCFDWEHVDATRGLLRTRVSNNWQITKQTLQSGFYTPEQQDITRKIFEGLLAPEWIARVDKQLKDDAGGWGKSQSLAIFGTPGDGKFELVMTGRHMTLRCDGNSADHVAFGGPIFYGHAASGFTEKPGHPDNVYWPQAVAAGSLFDMLDGKQRDQALVQTAPDESDANFKGAKGKFDGIRIAELSSDQKENAQKVLQMLLSKYRKADQQEALACLKTQGGLDDCRLAFYKEGNLEGDSVWDLWRLEGPSFVWNFRGTPHVHVWVHVADSADVKLNA